MHPLAVAFSGSAEALRRHGRRDLAINLVLGGLYTPVARRHTADYLLGHTVIDGTPLAQVPVRKSRWPAILLVLAFLAARLANEVGHGPPLPVLVVCAVLLFPYLWGTVAARTLGAIRWRGLPLSLGARWRDIYAASWPLFVLGAAWALAEPRVAAAASAGSATQLAAGTAVAALVVCPLLAAFAFNLRRLRFAGARVGGLAVTWPARLPGYLRIWALAAAAGLATAVAPVLLLRHALFGSVVLRGPPTGATLAVYAGAIGLVALLSTPARAWYEAQVFVLSWNGLRLADRLRIECVLDVRAFVRMRTGDAWRTLLTLGRHRARAVVQAHEAKLAALRVWADVERLDAR